MTHIHPIKNDPYHRFVCDNCGAVAGAHEDEQKAREQMNKVVTSEGWRLVHPHWSLCCPQCQQEQFEVLQKEHDEYVAQNITELLYTPGFANKIEINGDFYCRADSLLPPEPGLKYFRQLQLLAFQSSWYGQLITKLVKPEFQTFVDIPFVACVGYANDWSAYIGWPHPRFWRDNVQDGEYYQEHWKPYKVAQVGDKIDQEFAEELFPFLKVLTYRP